MLLLTLAAIQFTHIVDFMIMMPLGSQFMRIFAIGPREFGFLVSAYTLAACASGFVAAFWVDRFDRKYALLVLYFGLIVATTACGFAPGYGWLLLARILAGVFGGVIGALILAIVADLVPYARRGRATALVSASFSLAAVAGVPAGLFLAGHYGWRSPFLVLAATSALVLLAAARLLPSMSLHVIAGAAHRAPVAQLVAIFGEPNHLRAFALILGLMFAGFTVIPFIAPFMVTTLHVTEAQLPWVYLTGGFATLFSSLYIGRLADRYGKRRVFQIVAAISIAPIIAITHLGPLPLPAILAVSVVFFILVTGRFGPATALITGSVRPELRGSFMSFNASIQQAGAGLASLLAGLVVTTGADGGFVHFDVVGWVAAAATLACIVLARFIQVVPDGSTPAGRE